jgi:hypothetical protein
MIKLFNDKKEQKYKIDDYVRLIENENPDVFFIAKVLDINDELDICKYYIETFDKASDNIVHAWLYEDEILKKANSKEKSLHIKKSLK